MDVGVSVNQSLGWESQKISTLHLPREPPDLGVVGHDLYEGNMNIDNPDVELIEVVSAVGGVSLYPEMITSRDSQKKLISLTESEYQDSVMDQGFDVCMVLTGGWKSDVLNMTHFVMKESFKRLMMLNAASVRLSVPTMLLSGAPRQLTKGGANVDTHDDPCTVDGFDGGVVVYDACLGTNPARIPTEISKGIPIIVRAFAYSWMIVLDYSTHIALKEQLILWSSTVGCSLYTDPTVWLHIWADHVYHNLVLREINAGNYTKFSTARHIDQQMRMHLSTLLDQTLDRFPGIMVRHVRPHVIPDESGDYPIAKLRSVEDHVSNCRDRARVLYAIRKDPTKLDAIAQRIIEAEDKRLQKQSVAGHNRQSTSTLPSIPEDGVRNRRRK
jgi:hypothetical protein